mmetsp:Transcript_24068/g.35828  ORF Transcript_24068/g.35828 Transcript_24068/m.35828 type:complete len:180 (-) Transcript_24068:29-568(-)
MYSLSNDKKKSSSNKLTRRRGTSRKERGSTMRYFFIALIFFLIFVAGASFCFVRHTIIAGENGNALRGSSTSTISTSYLDTFPYIFNSTLDINNYKVLGGERFSEWIDGDTPYEINDDTIAASDKAARERREHVKNSISYTSNTMTKNPYNSFYDYNKKRKEKKRNQQTFFQYLQLHLL